MNKNLEDYLVDSLNNVYYKGKFNGIEGSLSAKLESVGIGNSVTTKALSGNVISGRYGHSAVLYNGKMIVFGGLGSDWTTTYNDCKEIY